MHYNTVKYRWFLVQVNHIETEILKMNSLCTGYYHVTLLSRHPADKYICDYVDRWWTECHDYYLNNKNTPVYNIRMIFRPKLKPALTKCMLWTSSIMIHLGLSMDHLILTHNLTSFLLTNILLYVIGSSFSLRVMN